MKELYYTAEEVARILHKSKETIYDWCKHGELAGARKFGREWYIPRTTIDPPQPPPTQATEQTNRSATE